MMWKELEYHWLLIMTITDDSTMFFASRAIVNMSGETLNDLLVKSFPRAKLRLPSGELT